MVLFHFVTVVNFRFFVFDFLVFVIWSVICDFWDICVGYMFRI